VPATNDEIEALGHTLNALLGRLDEALGRERRLLSEASHELRTPLTVLLTEVQVALRGDHDADELREALESVGHEAKRLSIVALQHRAIDAELADRHYAEHVERDFYPPLRAFVTSGPMLAAVLEGDEAVEVVRAINGATDGRKAAPGTVRGDFSLSNRENLVHGSDSEESASREIKIWFPDLP